MRVKFIYLLVTAGLAGGAGKTVKVMGVAGKTALTFTLAAFPVGDRKSVV